MHDGTLMSAVDAAFARGPKHVRLFFTGGEPLLRWKSIRNTIQYALSRLPAGVGLAYEISTNGLLITDEIARFLEQHQFRLQLSFDGVASAQDFRQHGSFQALDCLLSRLHNERPHLFSRLHVSAIQTPLTVQHLSASVRYFLSKGVRDLILFPAMCWPEWNRWDAATLEHEFGAVYEDSLRHLNATGTVSVRLFRKRAGTEESPEPCSAMTGTNVVIDVDGQAYGCVLFAESYQELPSELLKQTLAPLRLGDFRSKDFAQRHEQYLKKIAEAPLFRDLDERYSSYGRCAACIYRHSCSVCPVAIACDPANTDPHRVPDFICAYNRVALKYRAMFPCLTDPLELLKPARQAG